MYEVHASIDRFYREDRFSVTARVSSALTSSGGWIVDHHQFSNLALSINFEIGRQHLPKLEAALKATGMTLSDESKSALCSAGSGGETVLGSLQIVFIHDEPGVRIPGPLG